MKLSALLSMALALSSAGALSIGTKGGRPLTMIHEPGKRELLQDIITWDEHSLFIRGERVMMFSGEVHPFRLPVPSLYIDIFQKIKALGFNMVSFYVDWALLEGKSGNFRAEGVLALEPFFEAATNAGIYLLARPGPYINAEVSGGGYPGWLQRIKGKLRTDATDFLDATDNYVAKLGAIIAKAQITNGGPVILYQPENEYSDGDGVEFPNKKYLQYVIDQARAAGIVVPLINNDAAPQGIGAPGTGEGSVDIYGHDGYPLGFDCAHPYTWPKDRLPTNYHETHEKQSPKTPFSIVEFQGGSYDPFGGWGYEQCSVLVNHEFERVFYKNDYASGVTILNLYMIFGGTNWGNLGHPGGYTSYDYGACIREDRRVDREKYSELKLQAHFLRVSPGYTTTTPGTLTTSAYTDNAAIAVTQLKRKDDKSGGDFYVVRHADYSSTDSASYKLKLSTSAGDVTVPQLGGSLSLHGRDSKVHVTDYPAGDYTVVYSTAEIFTWNKFADKTVLILYGGPGELHEFSIASKAKTAKHIEGARVSSKSIDGLSLTLQFEASPERKVVQIEDLVVYMLDRNSAYNYWTPPLPGSSKDGPAYGTSIMNPDAVIVNGGYLVRSASIDSSTLSLRADFNASTSLEIIGAPKQAKNLVVNGQPLAYKTNALGNWVSSPHVNLPRVNTPRLQDLDWYQVDSLPEVNDPSYDDSAWTSADHKTTSNPVAPLHTNVSLYGSDYGYNTGALLYRGYFTSTGEESKLSLWTQGGRAYASSVWLNGSFIGSFDGFDAANDHNSSYTLPNLVKGKRYVLTVIVDSNGFDENLAVGPDQMKQPRGIFGYTLVSSSGESTDISPWKMTGNLGGEDYADTFRGPLNEGGFFFERQGYHLPSPPVSDSKVFKKGSPFNGIDHAGVAYYAAKLPLDLPADKWDIPLSFVFRNSTYTTSPYRALLYVNGFQYGKYVSNIGPQTEFPVPEGIINHKGDNWIGVGIWALEKKGAKLPGLTIKSASPILTSREDVVLVDGPGYMKRQRAY